LTRQSWEHLIWLTEFAHDQGASLLQLHPLELTGRAEQRMPGQWPEDDTLARAYLLTLALAASTKREYRSSSMFIIGVPTGTRGNGLCLRARLATEGQPAAELLSPLVVQAEDLWSPMLWFFGELLSPVIEARNSCRVLAAIREARLSCFSALCLKVFEDVMAPHHELPFLNWYELMLPEAEPPRVLRISIAACRMILQWRLGLARCAGSASLAADRADVKRKTAVPRQN